MASLLICSGWPGARHRLKLVAASVPAVNVVETAHTVEESGVRLRSTRFDVALVDANLPGGGPKSVHRLVAEDHGTRIFVLGAPYDEPALAMALASGASGFFHLDLSHEELVAALAHVLVARQVEPNRFDRRSEPVGPDLTARELQVLSGMFAGKSNGEIGRGLFLSEDTVKTHARRLFRKLGVNDRAHAVARGFRTGLVP